MTEINLECTRGDTAEFTLNYAKAGVPIDLTGATITMTGRRGKGGTLVFQRTVGSGITIDADQTANRGKAVIRLAAASTSNLAAETVTLFYDIEVRTPDGDTQTPAKGDFVVTPDAT